jgi:hypothetical protein
MYLLTFFSYNTFCHLQLIYHMRLVLGDYRDFSCKMSLATKILLQTLVENTQFSSSVLVYVCVHSYVLPFPLLLFVVMNCIFYIHVVVNSKLQKQSQPPTTNKNNFQW